MLYTRVVYIFFPHSSRQGDFLVNKFFPYIIDPAYKIILANLDPVTPPQKYTDVLYRSDNLQIT